jgi:geranyl-CoA carboxylase beta subunit
MGLDKVLRAQEIALQNKLPYVQLVESAGANLLQYKVEGFVHGGSLFRNLARLSAAGMPVVTVQHGSSTAGGAYMPGLSDHVIMVRGRAKAFLAGPPLLKAATGEVATEEELGGAEMHTSVSGLGEYLAEDDRHAVRLAREVMAQLDWGPAGPAASSTPAPAAALRRRRTAGRDAAHHREPVDMREVIARIVDGSELLEFKRRLRQRHRVRPCGALKAMRWASSPTTARSTWPAPTRPRTSSSACCQLRHPLIYLQNTTGYMVGKAASRPA